MAKWDILHISDELFSVQDTGTVINFVCSFNVFLYILLCIIITAYESTELWRYINLSIIIIIIIMYFMYNFMLNKW